MGAAADGELAGQSPVTGVPDLDPVPSPGARGHPTSIRADVEPLQVRVPGEGHGRFATLQVEDDHATELTVEHHGQGPAVAAEANSPGGEAGQGPQGRGRANPDL